MEMHPMDEDASQSLVSGGTSTSYGSANKKEPAYKGGLIKYMDEHPDKVAEEIKHTQKARETVARSEYLRILLGLTEMRTTSVYRAAFIEFCFTTLFQFGHIAIVATATSTKPVPSPSNASVVSHELVFPSPGLPIAIGHAILLTLFIFAAAAPSGGHMNPTITFATMCTGHTSAFRTLVYFIAQMLGSTIGSVLMRIVLGWDSQLIAPNQMAICNIGTLPPMGALVAEVMFTFILLFPCFGIAFDPKQGQLFGPIGAPICVGITLGLILFAASGLSPGYEPGMNVALCFGPSAAMGFSFLPTDWIYWLGPAIACIVHGVIFIVAPPHHSQDGCFTPVLLVEHAKTK